MKKLKTIFSKIALRIRIFMNWTFSKDVLHAINSGETYEEVNEIARKKSIR